MQVELNDKIRSIVLEEMDLSRDVSDEEIEDLIGTIASRELKNKNISFKERIELEKSVFHSL